MCLIIVAIISLILLSSSSCTREEDQPQHGVEDTEKLAEEERMDDTEHLSEEEEEDSAPVSSGEIGLSAGGAKDINNLRENIQNDYLPLPTDIT